MSDLTLVLSGPLAQRAPLLATLHDGGINVDQVHGPRGFDTDPTVGWIVARHPDVDQVVTLAGSAGWVLRSHWDTPVCAVCGGTSPDTGLGCGNCAGTGRTEKRPPDPGDVIADLQARLAALEAKAV